MVIFPEGTKDTFQAAEVSAKHSGMKRPMSQSKDKLLSSLAVKLALCTSLVSGGFFLPGILQQDSRFPVVIAQTTKKASLPREDYVAQDQHSEPSESSTVVRKEDVDVYAAFILLQRLLPVGAHLGSGFRDQNDQIRVIRAYALRNNIPVPPAGVTDPNAWRPAAAALRSRGYKIADPDRTPHSSDQKIVLDIGRADFGKIQEACYRAEQNGWIKILNLILEPKQGIHVELNLTQKGMFELGLRQTLPSAHLSESETSQPSQSPMPVDDDGRTQVMQELISLHDSTPDPLKKIDFDEQRKKLFEKFYPFDQGNIARIDDEIKQHRVEAKENESNETKQSLIKNVENAAEMGDLQSAEAAAGILAQRFPEQKATLDQIRVRRLLAGAIEALIQPDCNKCEEAGRLVGEALKISAGDERSQRIKGEVDICISQCRTRRNAWIILIILGIAGLAVGLYFGFRPKDWILECIEGPCKGQVFLLDKPKLTIGALDSSENESEPVDIVISDLNHKISRVHCSLRQRGRHFYLKDKSSNGTKINMKPIAWDHYVKLSNGDEISLADEAVLMLKRK